MKIRKDIGKEKSFNAVSWAEDYTPINELIEWLTEMQKQGATHIDWKAITGFEAQSDEVHAQALLEREETKEEELKRLEKEHLQREQYIKAQEQKERMEYERLSKKYGIK